MSASSPYCGIATSTLAFLSTFVVNFIFSSAIGTNAVIVRTPAMPANWAFSIWGIIYAWQFVWILYVWYTNYSAGVNILNLKFHLGYAVGCVFQTVWVITLGSSSNFRDDLGANIAAYLFLDAIGIGVAVALFVSLFVPIAPEKRNAFYGIVSNGLVLYLFWVGLAAPSLSFGMILARFGSLSVTAAAYATLTYILVIVLVFWFAEFCVFPDEMSVLFGHYFTLTWALIAVVSQGLTSGPRFMALGILCLGVLVLIGKIFWVLNSRCSREIVESDDNINVNRSQQAVVKV